MPMGKLFFLFPILTIVAIACSSPIVTRSVIAEASTASPPPRAVVYKMSSNYEYHVPVTLDAGKTRLISYPAPSDVTPNTAPVKLIDGYYLDRQGVNVNTVFLKWTRDEYSNLTKTPSKGDILENLMPLSYIADIVSLPMSINEALADTAEVNKLIREGFPGCRIIKGKPVRIGDANDIIGTQL